MRFLTVFFFYFLINFTYSQSFSFHGGYGLGRHWGTHFSAKCDIINTQKITFALNYTMVKTLDNRAWSNDVVSLHKINRNDKTLFEFSEFERGIGLQKNAKDPRPTNISHRFSFYTGYKLFRSNDFHLNVYLGPHFFIDRTILDNVTTQTPGIIVKNGDDRIELHYSDFQIYRSWDLGIGSRVEVEYNLFKNVSLGLSSQMFFDVLQEGIDLIVGGGISYHFNPSK